MAIRQSAASGFVDQMSVNLGSGDGCSARKNRMLKLRRWMIQNFNFERRIPGQALDGFAGFGRRKENAIFEIQRRLAGRVVGMARDKADFASHADPQRTGRMDREAFCTVAARRRSDHAGVMTMVVNPKTGVAIDRIVEPSRRTPGARGGLLAAKKFLQLFGRMRDASDGGGLTYAAFVRPILGPLNGLGLEVGIGLSRGRRRLLGFLGGSKPPRRIGSEPEMRRRIGGRSRN